MSRPEPTLCRWLPACSSLYCETARKSTTALSASVPRPVGLTAQRHHWASFMLMRVAGTPPARRGAHPAGRRGALPSAPGHTRGAALCRSEAGRACHHRSGKGVPDTGATPVGTGLLTAGHWAFRCLSARTADAAARFAVVHAFPPTICCCAIGWRRPGSPREPANAQGGNHDDGPWRRRHATPNGPNGEKAQHMTVPAAGDTALDSSGTMLNPSVEGTTARVHREVPALHVGGLSDAPPIAIAPAARVHIWAGNPSQTYLKFPA